MKNKERIEQLEKQIEVLLNRVAILEMKMAVKTFPQAPPAAPAPMPITWPTYPSFIPQPEWNPGYNPNIQPYTVTCGTHGSPTIQ